MITNATFEALAESEEKLDKEATELESLFPRGKAIAQPFDEEKWEPDVLCPRPQGALGNALARRVLTATNRECSVDKQLWSVRPPHRGLTHRFVLAWVKHALELGGYDPRNMLTEWQIFWRRKGV
jgi:hypothetical protein